MVTVPRDQSDADQLDEIILELLRQAASGAVVSPDHWVARYLEFREQLLEFFGDRLRLERLAAPLRAIAVPQEVSELSACLGDFRIIRELGRGGMGVVYEAEQVSLRRRVALKVLPFASVLDARQLKRLRNEAQAAAVFDQPVFCVR